MRIVTSEQMRRFVWDMCGYKGQSRKWCRRRSKRAIRMLKIMGIA